MQENIKNILGKYSVDELIHLAMELDEEYFPTNSGIRKLSLEIFGKDDLIHIMGLGVPLSVELATRIEENLKKEKEKVAG